MNEEDFRRIIREELERTFIETLPEAVNQIVKEFESSLGTPVTSIKVSQIVDKGDDDGEPKLRAVPDA